MPRIEFVKGKAEVVGEQCIGSKWNIDMTTGCACRHLGGNCTYCYGVYINAKADGGPDFIKELNEEKLIAQIKRDNIKTVRFGKFTDPGAKWTLPHLKRILAICYLHDVRPIIVTKLLPFDEEIASFVEGCDGVIHYSLGDDKCEPGACSVNTNLDRVNLAATYREHGTNTIVRIVEDVTTPPSHNSYATYARQANVPILLTPIRCKSKDELMKWTGLSLNMTKERYSHCQGFYRPDFIHEQYRGVRICGETSDEKIYCGKCFLEEPSITVNVK